MLSCPVQVMLQGYIPIHTTKVQNILQELFREIAYSILKSLVLYSTYELTQLYTSSLSMISATFIYGVKGVMVWSNLKVQMLFLVFCITNKPPRPHHFCLSLAEVNSLIQIFVNILQLVSERYSALQRNESRCCFHFYTGDTAPARSCHLLGKLVSVPFIFQTVILPFPFPLPPPSGSCRTASSYCPAEIDLSWVKLPDPWRRKEGKQPPTKTKPVPIHTPNLEYYPCAPAASSYYCILSCHDFLVESCLYNLWALLEQPNFTSIKYYDCIDFHHKSYFPSSVSLSLHWLN